MASAWRIFLCALILATEAHSETLEGLWSAEIRFGIPARGELTIDGRNGNLRALLAGYHVAVQKTEKEFRFTLPGAAGEFRGRLDVASKEMRGHWIQPAGVMLNAKYASRVLLQAIGDSVWRGMVVPLEDRISLFVFITPSPDGKLSGFIRNPEMNLFRRRLFSVLQEGRMVHLEANGWKIEGTYNAQADVLTLPLLDGLPTVQFSRRKREEAIGFSARAGETAVGYEYRVPLAEAAQSSDGWAVASLADEGIDKESVQRLVNRIIHADVSDNPANIQSLLIARHGRLVLEEYFYGFSKDRPHDMRSAGKTFAPVLVGLAREQGAKLGPETPVSSLFPQYRTFANQDARKAAVTLRDVMTMTAGNACDDNDDNSPGNEDKMQDTADWYKHTLDLPMVKKPGGEQAVYCSGDLNLVGGAVAGSIGGWLPEFFEKYLARPLNFGRYYLNLMPDGQAYMGGGAYLRPRDELKLGQLFLDGGLWKGKRLLSKEWVAESTAFHSRFAPEFSLGQEHQYGYGWHINFLKSGGKIYRALAADGNGGQFVIVIPELAMVIGINGGSYGEFDKWYRWELELVPEFLIPAVQALR